MRTSLLAALAASSIVAVLACVHARPCDATQVVRLSLGEAAARADLVVEARVLAKSARIGPRKRVETEYVLRVDRALFGAPASAALVRVPGGVLPDGSGMLVPGMPSFAVGDDVVLMLGREQEGGMRVPVGLAQGALRVARDARGERVLARDLTGLEFPRERVAPPSSVPYAQGMAEIQAAIAARGEQR